jgi:hypothetical protein
MDTRAPSQISKRVGVKALYLERCSGSLGPRVMGR